MTHTTKEADGAAAHRRRLLEGMAHSVATKGYADTTIADVVREAAVSRRTFYEHFDAKSDCLIALYGAASHNALKVLREAIDPARDWQAQLENAIRAYFGCLAQNPKLMRTLFVEILGLGSAGLLARRRVNEEIAALLLDVVNNGHQGRQARPLSPEMAMAVVGGINELVLQVIEQDRIEDLPALTAPAIELLHAVTEASC
jgi:AcrR family transcriptional regulator